MSEHQQYREWVAAYILGALDPAERSAFEAHLQTCDDCGEELKELAPLPGLLNRVDLTGPTPAPESVVDRAVASIASEWAAMKRSRTRWRWLAAVAAVVAVVALVAPIVTGPEPLEGTVVVFEPASPASGSVLVEEKAWGTAVAIELSGLPESDTYVAWAVSGTGEWEQMATWGPTPSLSAKLSGASSMAPGELAAIVVTTGDRSETVARADVGA